MIDKDTFNKLRKIMTQSHSDNIIDEVLAVLTARLNELTGFSNPVDKSPNEKCEEFLHSLAEIGHFKLIEILKGDSELDGFASLNFNAGFDYLLSLCHDAEEENKYLAKTMIEDFMKDNNIICVPHEVALAEYQKVADSPIVEGKMAKQKYYIVSSNSIDGLIEKVNRKMDEDYKLRGEVFTSELYSLNQALVFLE